MSDLPSRPRVRPEHNPYRITGGRIRIGGNVHGVAAELADPDGTVWDLMTAMDGVRTLDGVIEHLRGQSARVTPQWVRSAVDRLNAAGHLDDTAAPPPPLSARDMERHERGRRFFRWIDPRPAASGWDPVVALRSASVTVVGLGGTGGQAALSLAAAGVGALHCVDGDHVELSNLNRQLLFDENDIGKSKVDAGVEHLRRLDAGVAVSGRHRYVESEGELTDLAAACDVLVLAADSPDDIARWANRACLATGRPWVDAGYHGPVVTVASYLPGAGPCRECTRMAQRDRHRAAQREPLDPVVRVPTGAVIAPAAGISGHLAAIAAVAIITGVPRPVPGIRALSLADPQHAYMLTDPRRPDCPDCGGPR